MSNDAAANTYGTINLEGSGRIGREGRYVHTAKYVRFLHDNSWILIGPVPDRTRKRPRGGRAND